MSISAPHNVNFKGYIRLYTEKDGLNLTKPKTFDTDNIKEINCKLDKTEIISQAPGAHHFTSATVPYDVETIVKAYTAAKNSPVRIDYTIDELNS